MPADAASLPYASSKCACFSGEGMQVQASGHTA